MFRELVGGVFQSKIQGEELFFGVGLILRVFSRFIGRGGRFFLCQMIGIIFLLVFWDILLFYKDIFSIFKKFEFFYFGQKYKGNSSYKNKSVIMDVFIVEEGDGQRVNQSVVCGVLGRVENQLRVLVWYVYRYRGIIQRKEIGLGLEVIGFFIFLEYVWLIQVQSQILQRG